MNVTSRDAIPPAKPAHTFRPVDEEIVNAITHGLGLLLSLLGAGAILIAGRDIAVGRQIACLLYAASLVAVYAISMLSHAVQEPVRKHALRVLDQGVIYLLIAGTYTPLIYAYAPRQAAWPGLTLVWLAAIAGKYSKVVSQRKVVDFSSHTYLWLGWIPALVYFRYVPVGCLVWMAVGGVTYTVGTYFLLNDRLHRHFHAIWHLFVIAASMAHYYAIWHYVIVAPTLEKASATVLVD